MKYGYTALATDWTAAQMNHWAVRLFYTLLFFIPRANRDNEKLFPQVARWLIEIDENGVPVREIGLNAEGTPLFTAPNNRNYGLWPDSGSTINPSELDLTDQETFEAMWAKFNP